MSFFKRYLLSFSFTGSSSLDFSPLLFFRFLVNYFLSCLCLIKILQTRKLYPASFITQLTLCNPARVMSSDLR